MQESNFEFNRTIDLSSRSRFPELQTLKRNWGWFTALGAALVALGVIATGTALLTTLASVMFFGWLLIVGGIFQAIHAFQIRNWGGFFLNFIASLFYVVAGVVMISEPLRGAVGLTILLSSFFLVTGVIRAVGSATLRFPRWGWFCFAGIVTAALGLLILAELPTSAAWVIGTFVGIEMILSGVSLLNFSFMLRAIPPSYEERVRTAA